MNKAIFLDRDGVLNRERGEYSYLLEHFFINEGVPEFLKKCQDKGYLLIVISNQGGIGRGVFPRTDVEKCHAYMTEYLKEQGVELTEVYYCPHHDKVEKCLCRKPGTLMLEKAIARFQIDKTQSFFIGDNERDMIAGNKAGIHSILIKPNQDLRSILHLIPL